MPLVEASILISDAVDAIRKVARRFGDGDGGLFPKIRFISLGGHVFVAGVDGCRNGWIVFCLNGASTTAGLPHLDTSCRVVSHIAELLHEFSDSPFLIGIDIPIGLADGSRSCDIQARKLLGKPSSSSVFPAPCRAALSGKDYADASRINRLKTGKGLSRQSWGIAPKIKEVDGAVRSLAAGQIFEVHPELSFWRMNEKHPLHPKKTPEGKAQRRNLLEQSFPRIHEHLDARPTGVGIDDLLDAAAATWTMLRHLRGESKFAGNEEADEFRLPMKIYY